MDNVFTDSISILLACTFEEAYLIYVLESSDVGVFNNKSNDFVSAIEVIEHQYDPFLFIEQLSKVTEDNGYVIISTPYHGYFKNLLISILGKFDSHLNPLWEHGHIKFWSIKTLQKLL